MIARDRLADGPVEDEPALAQQHRTCAQALDRGRVVRDEDDRPAALLELVDLAEALALELLVADGEHLVEQQHVDLEVRGDGEAEAHDHARRVRADGQLHEALELGERLDLGHVPADRLALEPEDRAVQVDVLAAGELRVEAGAELEQAADRARRRSTRPAVGFMIPATTLSSVVLPEPLRPIRPTASPGSIEKDTSVSASTSRPLIAPARDQHLLQRPHRLRIDAEPPADVVDLDRSRAAPARSFPARVARAPARRWAA